MNWSFKHDLLYMFICLGHLPDRDLNKKEAAVIISRSKKWLSDIEDADFIQIKEEVTAKYLALSSFQARYDQYLKSAFNLKAVFNGNEIELVHVMTDLIQIADADHEVREEEVALIKAAVKAWWLDIDPRLEAESELLNGGIKTDSDAHLKLREEEDWTYHHDLLYMLICMGHLPDKEFSNEEVYSITSIWDSRFPKMSSGEFQQIRARVMRKYNMFEVDNERLNHFLLCALRIKEKHKRKSRALTSILKDLFSIVRADRHILQNEITLIEAAATVWGLGIEITHDSNNKVKLVILQA